MEEKPGMTQGYRRAERLCQIADFKEGSHGRSVVRQLLEYALPYTQNQQKSAAMKADQSGIPADEKK
jgi:hypothetical protein